MAIEYSSSTIVNTTFTSDGTRRQLVDQLSAALTTAGWSTISGGSTADVLMKTAVTPDGLSVRLRLFDPASGNCAQFTIKHSNGTAGGIGYLLPTNLKVFRIIATKYHFFMFTTGTANYITGRETICGGTIWAPSFIISLLTDFECGWFMHASTNDTTGTLGSIHVTLAGPTSGNDRGSTGIFNSQIMVPANFLQYHVIICAMLGKYESISDYVYRWQDNSLIVTEPYIAWASLTASTTSKVKGQLWDALVVGGPVDRESTITFDGHTWMALTHQATGIHPATLYVMVA